MKNFIIGSMAAIVATLSLASTADAGWRHRYHGWHHRPHWGVVVVAPRRYYGDYCFVKRVRHYDDWGNLYVRKVRICN